jgi:phenylacetate-CoA ligase
VSLGRVAARALFPVVERLEGRRIRPKLARLRAEAAAPAATRRRLQAERVAAVVRHAARHVPHYREAFAACGFDPRDLDAGLAVFAAIPTLDREVMMAAGPRLLDERLDPAALHVRRTGGSTGRSAAVRYSSDALDWTAAVNLFVREWTGQASHAPEAHLSTAPGFDVRPLDRAREWVKCASLNRTNLPIDGWDTETLERLRRDLERVRPALLHGHPSTVHALALHVREHGGAARLFDVFESTGEALEPGARKTIEETLGGRVVDRYGSAEFGVVAYERPGGRPGMEILDGVVFAETLPDGAGNDELVLTGLRNDAMPLVRYRTGDLVRIACEPDEVSGRIVAIQGRVHDAVQIAGRRVPTHVIQDRLDRFGCVEEFQVEVTGDAVPRLRVAAPAREHPQIRAAVREWWGDGLDLEFAPREAFVRAGWRGKHRHLVTREARP